MFSIIYILSTFFGNSVLSPAIILLFAIIDATLLEAVNSLVFETNKAAN